MELKKTYLAQKRGIEPISSNEYFDIAPLLIEYKYYSADDVMGSWKVIARYENGSSVNSATPCNLQLSTIFFGENHLFTMKTGNTTTTGTCSATTSTYDEYYILVGIVRIEKDSNTKIVFAAEIVDGNLQLTETGYQNSSGFHSVDEVDQVTYIYEKQ